MANAKANAKSTTKTATKKGATKKSAVAAPAPDETRASGAAQTAAIANAERAVGAASVRPGFGFDADDDLRFALGWPSMRRLVEGGDGDPAAFALAAVDRAAPPLGLVDWPMEAARRYVRALATVTYKFDFKLNKETQTPELAKALKKAGPVTAAEARDAVVKFIERRMFGGSHKGDDFLFLVEAMHGPELVASAIADAFERAPEGWWKLRGGSPLVTALRVGFFLLRMKESDANAARARFEAIWADKKKSLPESQVVTALDVSLHGREGAERSGMRDGTKIHPMCLVYSNDRSFVAEHAVATYSTAKSHPPDARLAFLGGDAVVRVVVERHRQLLETQSNRVEFVNGWDRVRDPSLEPVFEWLAKSSETKEAARAWLARVR